MTQQLIDELQTLPRRTRADIIGILAESLILPKDGGNEEWKAKLAKIFVREDQ